MIRKKIQYLSNSEKRSLLVGTLLGVPVSLILLYMGFVLAVGSESTSNNYLRVDELLLDSTHRYSWDCTEEVDEELTYEVLDDTLRTVFQTAGVCPEQIFLPEMVDLSFDYEPKKQTWWWESRPEVTIRPVHAQRVWKRLQKHARFVWPVSPETFWVSSYYGPRTLKGQKGFHKGIDLAASAGTPVKAAGRGKVIEASYSSGYGNYIVVEHTEKYRTRYAHLQKILVKQGQYVRPGQRIGDVGDTGKVTSSWGRSASHLHFEVYKDGKRINPFCVLA